MSKILTTFTLLLLAVNLSFGQTDSTNNSISDQIKIERDKQLKELGDKLKLNEDEVKRLKEKLSSIDDSKTKEKLKTIEDLQSAVSGRLKILEEAPKTKLSLNGQLAFTELLSIQRDLQPAALFVSSREFFNQLGNVSNLQKYSSFNSWKTEYDKWYTAQDKNDQMLQLINNSISLICNPASKVPLYGSITQTASYGISSIISTMGRKNKELVNKTPLMLRLLNATSQFDNQKAIIDHEWNLINKELDQLQIENDGLLKEQFNYYGITLESYQNRYLNATLDNERDKYKNECRKIIIDKFAALDTDSKTNGKWMGQVETYMYKVQSLRLRFGQLTNRMLTNISQYEQLIELYSDDSKFTPEFTTMTKGLGKSLSAVRKNFNSSFKPEKYIEDSAVMYIEKR
ncbi:hypothetical protein [Solitalea koreensis]|uniref:Uncharacterized protein n=1 Tax=Solitalea koreensis TaxID=543615 RepID=A0A521E577_9SPHI|nr:hypothetical protein [Solitalea koreensis]SMO79104.1 hypothetical protein SAMN06265350_11148 [Solitalea koreensis]